MLSGVHQPHYLPANSYVFNENTEMFEQVTAEKSAIVHPFSSFLTIPESLIEDPASNLDVILRSKTDYPSAIKGSYADSVHPVDNTTYNLMGMPVDEHYKGIVIRNGKKYIQK